MPLALADVGEELIIRRVGGKPEVRQHLADMGFVAGSTITVVNKLGDNVIVNVKDVRVAISREMSQKIMI